MADEFSPQTAEMYLMILHDLEKQERELQEDPERSRIYNGPHALAIQHGVRVRKELFALVLSLIPDQPRLRLEVFCDIVGVMAVLAGATCEHGSCYLYSEIDDSIKMWKARLPLLAVGQDVHGDTKQMN